MLLLLLPLLLLLMMLLLMLLLESLLFLFLRIMDCFLSDGLEVIFRLALALLLMGKHELLVQDMEGVIRVSTVFNLLYLS